MDSDDTSQQCVFISHGRNSAWREVQAYVEKDLKLKTIELSQEPYSGRTNIQRLAEEADKCNYAVIVMTGDDATPEGATRARENVIHEIGFFQAKYGFDGVCIVFQEGVSIPSNIDGLGRAQFKGTEVSGAFVALAREIRAWLRKIDNEKVTTPQGPNIQITNKLLSDKKAKFKSVVLELEEEWLAERDGSGNVDKGKFTLRKLSSAVGAHKADLDDLISDELKMKLRNINMNVKSLDEWGIYMDGGSSYNKFWGNGDAQFQDLRNVIAEIK